MEKTTSVHTKDKRSQYLKRTIESYIPHNRFSCISTEVGIFFAKKILSIAQQPMNTEPKVLYNPSFRLPKPEVSLGEPLCHETSNPITEDFEEGTNAEESAPENLEEAVFEREDETYKRIKPPMKTDEDYFDEVTQIIQNLIDQEEEDFDDEISEEPNQPEIEPIGKDFSLWLDEFRENQRTEDSVYSEMFSAVKRALRLDETRSKDIVKMVVPEIPIKNALNIIQEILANREDLKFSILKDDVDAVVHLFQTILASNPSYTLDNLIDKAIDMALDDISEDL